ncbi:MAG: DRTGG domain-containing protein [Oscillospiraceae bacterium]
MTAIEMAQTLNFKVINIGEGKKRTIDGVYCCDLLSVVMGRAKANDAWITVMGNVNSIAVAVLSDVSCIILSENKELDIDSLGKAKAQDVCVLSSELPTYEIAIQIKEAMHS